MLKWRTQVRLEGQIMAILKQVLIGGTESRTDEQLPVGNPVKLISLNN
jgi:hypothetical protein